MRRNVTGTRKRRRIFWPAAAAAAVTLLAAVLLALGWYALRGRSAEGPLLPHLRRPAQRHVVAVDAGHGGADVGAKGLVDETAVTQATAAALLVRIFEDKPVSPFASRHRDKVEAWLREVQKILDEAYQNAQSV